MPSARAARARSMSSAGTEIYLRRASAHACSRRSSGVREDPATGSAAAALAGVLTAHGGLGAGAHKVIIEQGREMGRPSTIELELKIDGAKLTAASIGGDAVIVSQGTLKA